MRLVKSGRGRLSLALAAVLAIMVAVPAFAQFTAGQLIEYKDGSSWAPGVVVTMTPGNSQVVIRRAPSQFFPEGYQSAYSLSDVRPRQPAQPAAGPAPGAKTAAAPAKAPAAPTKAAPVPAIPQGAGLLTEAQVLAYARQAMGPGDPYANPNREAALAQIRDFIKARGVSFVWSLPFDNQLGAIGANSVHITSAIGANYGPTPTLSAYIGHFALTSQVRAAQSVRQAGGRTVLETTDAAARLGEITINADHTYVWNVLGDNRSTIRGTWREATEDEKQFWEGGPSIWLLNARGGQDYQVRADRQPGWTGWIDMGQGKGRIAVQYGKRM